MRGSHPDDEVDAGAGDDRSRLIRAAHTEFAIELKRRRRANGFTQAGLAARLGYDTSYVSKMESRRANPTAGFAKRADEVLHANGVLRHLEEQGRADGTMAKHAPTTQTLLHTPTADWLTVLSEVARLSYDDTKYRAEIGREIENVGPGAINGYLIRIHVDRFLDDPKRSREFYRANPLLWEDLDIRCWYGDRIEFTCEPDQIRTDQVIEGLVRFRDKESGERFPLEPGQRMSFTYTYTVDADKWGRWFQRQIRFPTRQLSVVLDFPVRLDPYARGTENTLGQPPIGLAVHWSIEQERSKWTWSTAEPRLGDRYRFEWRFDDR